MTLNTLSLCPIFLSFVFLISCNRNSRYSEPKIKKQLILEIAASLEEKYHKNKYQVKGQKSLRGLIKNKEKIKNKYDQNSMNEIHRENHDD